MQALRRLNRLFQGRYLLPTNVALGATLLGTADALQQNIEIHVMRIDDRQRFSWRRTGKMFLAGALVAPLGHAWYSFLDRRLPGVAAMTIVKKVLTDMLVAAPVFIYSLVVVVGMLDGQTYAEAWRELRSKFLLLYVVDCAVWPVAQTINFAFVPPPYRLLYINTIVLFWDIFFCYVKYMDMERVPSWMRPFFDTEKKEGKSV